MDKLKRHSAFISVLIREWNRMTSRRLYFGVCIILPLFCVFYMATIFGSGQMENIPIGIVDYDQTATSRGIIRTISAIPTFKITDRDIDDVSARNATQKKKIYGYLVIPPNFEANVSNGNGATLSYYYHYALLSVGSEVKGAFETVLRTLSISPVLAEGAALGIEENRIEDFLVPVNTQNHPLYNPDLDYSVYLSNPFFFILFQVLILLVTVYSIGTEIKFKTGDDWLKCADMNMVTAIFAKILPYTVIFSIIGIFANYVMFGIMHIPFSCGFWPINLTTVLFIIATQALGIFLFSLFPAISIIISIVSMVGSLGATLSGVTFPAPSFFPVIYYLSFLFPVRHFIEINQNLLYGDYGYAYTWQNVSALFVFILVTLPILPHLKKAIISHKYENIK